MASIPVNATAQTGAQITGSTSTAGLRPQDRTFSLTGTMGATIVRGDIVAIWGSNDGGRTFQPLRTAFNKQVLLTFDNPECVIDDACDTYATQRVGVGAGSALAAVGFNGESVFINPSPAWVQGGNAGFGPVGILGTTDAVPLRIVVNGNTIVYSDGVTTTIGNSSLNCRVNVVGDGSGGIDIETTGGGLITLISADGIEITPGPTASVSFPPRSAGAGNTTPVQFRELAANGVSFVGFRAPDALAASTTYTLPNAGATIAGQYLSSDAASATAQTLSWSGGSVNVLASNTSAQSIADGAAPAMLIGWTEIADSANAFNPVTGAFIAPVAGFYMIDVQIEFSAIAAILDAEFTAQVTLNGSAISVYAAICPVAALNQKRISHASIGIQLAALDQIDIRATQNSGSGANTLTNVAARNILTISRVG